MKMTKKAFEELEKNNVKLEADNGRLVCFFDDDNYQVCSWMDKNTFKFATPADYEHFGLEAIESSFLEPKIEKKCAGKSALEKIAEVEKSYTDNDKATIAHFNGRMYF